MLACSYCVSVTSPEWWTNAGMGRGIAAAFVGLLMAMVALRSVGRRRLGATLAAIGLLVALPLALLLGGTRTEIKVATSRPPSDAPEWHVSCATVFRSSAEADPWRAELEEACRDATVARRAATYALATAAAIVVVVGGWLMSFGGRPRRADPIPA